MKDFTTNKQGRLITYTDPETKEQKPIKVDDEFVYMKFAAGSMMDTAIFANGVNMEDVEQMDKMARMLFTENPMN
jgi:hypothetical protein